MFEKLTKETVRLGAWLRSGVFVATAGILAACSATPTVDVPTAQQQAPALLHQALYNFPDTAPAYEYRGVPKHGKAILVNIPSFELIAFEDGKPVLRSRVIVGKRSTPTPIMQTETSVVRFRPTWTPTPRMIRSGKYRPGTRPPGKRNPLGFLAIRLAPGMLIYLHGTNKPQLFDKDGRALSHGCVRVEKWDEVAAWVLDSSVEQVHGHAYGRRTFDAQTSGIPVIMSYQLRFPDANGVMRDWDDIYRRGTETVLAQTL
ncbi:MAG: L,D-transpeptidase family protein [Pseudomonadota bacterium]